MNFDKKRTIYYINKQQEFELLANPHKAWNLFEANVLLPTKLDCLNEEANIENILCYSKSYLNILVRTNQKQINQMDRAYPNGDGFHFVLAKPNKDLSATNEFYVIGISPLDTTWCNKFVWYKNIDLQMNILNETNVVYKSHNNKHYFNVQIPWCEIQPLKGLLYDNYGFNISYVQSVGKGTNVYMLKEDQNIQCEQSPREYVLYDFQKPIISKDVEVNFCLNKNHCKSSDILTLNIAINNNIKKNYELNVVTNNIMLINDKFEVNEGHAILSKLIDVNKLSFGSHCFEIKLKSDNFYTKETLNIFVYNQNIFDDLSGMIGKLENNNNQITNASKFCEVHIQNGEGHTCLTTERYKILSNWIWNLDKYD